MDGLLLHEQTSADIDHLVEHPNHAILLTGSDGAGKGSLAEHLAAKLLGIELPRLSTYAYYAHIIPINNTTPIETIRGLRDFLRLRTTGTGSIRRVVLIENAHTLTLEAQNAFLKILEEPPSDTVIILTAQGERSLLPTIYSRVQAVSVKPQNKEALNGYFCGLGYQESEIERAFYVSDGQIGLMSALLEDDTNHPLVSRIATAKELLMMPVFERLARVDSLCKQKEEIPTLLYALERISHAALAQAADKERQADIIKWHKIFKKVTSLKQKLRYNPSPKLLLTNLMLDLAWYNI